MYALGRVIEAHDMPFVRDIVRSYLLPLVAIGRGDLATDFAFHYPITVTAVAAGLPVDDVPMSADRWLPDHLSTGSLARCGGRGRDLATRVETLGPAAQS